MKANKVEIERKSNGEYEIRFKKKHLKDTVFTYSKEPTGAVMALTNAATLLCFMLGLEDRLPRHAKIGVLRGSITETDADEQTDLFWGDVKLDVEVSVDEDCGRELDRAIKGRLDNGCSMTQLLNRSGYFNVTYNIKKT